MTNLKQRRSTVLLAIAALMTAACGSATQNEADRISAAVVDASAGFDTAVTTYIPEPIEWEYCVPNPVVADLDVAAFDTLTSAGSKVSLTSNDRTGTVEILMFEDPELVVEVVGLYDWYLASRRECLASNEEADRILNGATDDREFTPLEVAGADAAFAATFSNLAGQVAYVDIAVASTGTGVIVVSFTSESGPIDPEVLEEIVAAGLAAS